MRNKQEILKEVEDKHGNMNYGDFLQYIRSLYNKTKWYEREK